MHLSAFFWYKECAQNPFKSTIIKGAKYDRMVYNDIDKKNALKKAEKICENHELKKVKN